MTVKKQRIYLYDFIRFILIVRMIWAHILFNLLRPYTKFAHYSTKVFITTCLFAFLMGIVIKRFNISYKKILKRGKLLFEVWFIINIFFLILGLIKFPVNLINIFIWGDPNTVIVPILLALSYLSFVIYASIRFKIFPKIVNLYKVGLCIILGVGAEILSFFKIMPSAYNITVFCYGLVAFFLPRIEYESLELKHKHYLASILISIFIIIMSYSLPKFQILSVLLFISLFPIFRLFADYISKSNLILCKTFVKFSSLIGQHSFFIFIFHIGLIYGLKRLGFIVTTIGQALLLEIRILLAIFVILKVYNRLVVYTHKIKIIRQG